MKVLNFGSCNIDYVYSVPNITGPGQTLRARKMEVFPGGKGLNQSVAAAASALAVSRSGAAPAIPVMAEVERELPRLQTV